MLIIHFLDYVCLSITCVHQSAAILSTGSLGQTDTQLNIGFLSNTMQLLCLDTSIDTKVSLDPAMLIKRCWICNGFWITTGEKKQLLLIDLFLS